MFIFILPMGLFAAKEPNNSSNILDVQTIVTKANIAAYYQGEDGKAKVNMVITDKSGRKSEREFIILRKDVNDGGDQNYFVYFQKPADVRKMTYMVNKHVKPDKDDDRWLYMPSLDLVKRIAAVTNAQALSVPTFFMKMCPAEVSKKTRTSLSRLQSSYIWSKIHRKNLIRSSSAISMFP